MPTTNQASRNLTVNVLAHHVECNEPKSRVRPNKPDSAEDRLCVRCKHFRLDLGGAGYSEQTPSEPASCECLKEHWDYGRHYGECTIEFRRTIESAKTCEDYEDYRKGGE